MNLEVADRIVPNSKMDARISRGHIDTRLKGGRVREDQGARGHPKLDPRRFLADHYVTACDYDSYQCLHSALSHVSPL